MNETKQEKVEKSLYFNSMEKEYIWKFPDDFEGEIAKNSNLKFLNDHSVSGEVYTKATPLKKSECGFLLYA